VDLEQLMAVYIILFRGVGGATQLPTAPLRAKLTEAGFENVSTYINSGNAVVKSKLGRRQVIETIAGICREHFGFEKAIYAQTTAEWDRLIDNNPFAEAVEPGNLLHAALLEAEPATARNEALQALAVNGDRFAVVDQVAYIHTPNGFSKSQMAAKFDKGIGVANTARNWNTVLKLRELARKAAG
jgi:uncharacterized protein (DUF1697 family)